MYKKLLIFALIFAFYSSKTIELYKPCCRQYFISSVDSYNTLIKQIKLVEDYILKTNKNSQTFNSIIDAMKKVNTALQNNYNFEQTQQDIFQAPRVIYKILSQSICTLLEVNSKYKSRAHIASRCIEFIDLFKDNIINIASLSFYQKFMLDRWLQNDLKPYVEHKYGTLKNNQTPMTMDQMYSTPKEKQERILKDIKKMVNEIAANDQAMNLLAGKINNTTLVNIIGEWPVEITFNIIFCSMRELYKNDNSVKVLIEKFINQCRCNLNQITSLSKLEQIALNAELSPDAFRMDLPYLAFSYDPLFKNYAQDNKESNQLIAGDVKKIANGIASHNQKMRIFSDKINSTTPRLDHTAVEVAFYLIHDSMDELYAHDKDVAITAPLFMHEFKINIPQIKTLSRPAQNFLSDELLTDYFGTK